MLARVPQQAGHPLDVVFDAARDVAQRRMRPDQHHHVGEAFHQDAEIGLRPACPFVLQPQPVHAANVDAIEAARDGIEPGRIDDDVELVLGSRWS